MGSGNYIQEHPTQIYILYTVNCERNVNKPSAPTEVEGKLTLWCDITVQQKNKLIYQVKVNTNDFWLSGQYGKCNSKIFFFHLLGPFPSKIMRSTWILCFDLLHCSTQIWRIRLGGSWSTYFLIQTNFSKNDLNSHVNHV